MNRILSKERNYLTTYLYSKLTFAGRFTVTFQAGKVRGEVSMRILFFESH